jgi:hypothetical protein
MDRSPCYEITGLDRRCCPYFSVGPPSGCRILYGVCHRHIREQDREMYKPDLDKLTQEHPDVNCPICHEQLKDLHPKQLVKLACCSNFFCADCIKDVQSCPLCKAPLSCHEPVSWNVSEMAGNQILDDPERIVKGLEAHFDSYIETLRKGFLEPRVSALRNLEKLASIQKSVEPQFDEVRKTLRTEMDKQVGNIFASYQPIIRGLGMYIPIFEPVSRKRKADSDS